MDWAIWLESLLGCLSIILGATFWILRTQFVTKEVYENDQKDTRDSLSSLKNSFSRADTERSEIVHSLSKVQENTVVLTGTINELKVHIATLTERISNMKDDNNR